MGALRRPAQPSVIIRTAVLAERKQVADLSKHHEYTRHFRTVAYCNRQRFENGWIIIAVADRKGDDDIVGFACIRSKKRLQEIELDIIGTHSDWRSKGVGAALIAWLKENGEHPRIVLDVKRDNPRAVAFYLRHGFVHERLSMDDTAFRMRWEKEPQSDDLRSAANDAMNELEVRAVRDVRQQLSLVWATRAFGVHNATYIPQRAVRLLEEVLELYQVAGADRDMAHKLVDYVFSRPVGELHKEIGGVANTLMILCAAAGLSLDEEEVREILRVTSVSPKTFAKRNEQKNADGFEVKK